LYEKISTDYGYEIYKDNIPTIKNDSFNEFKKLFNDEIFNEEHGIESYFISHFENSITFVQVIFKRKENCINEYIKYTQNIVELISKIQLSDKVFNDVKNSINVI